MSNSINITPEELSSITPFVIVDVRQDEEVIKQPLLGECKHIIMDKLLASSNIIDPEQNIVFVCAAGIRSKYIAEIYRSNGFSNTYSLTVGVSEFNEFYKYNNNKYD